MNAATLPVLVAIAIQLGLGAIVFQANPRRKANQVFLLLSLAIEGWLVSFYFAFSTADLGVAEFSIRQASACGAIILATFNLLRLSIRDGHAGWTVILRRGRLWLFAAAAVAAFSQTELFLLEARWPTAAADEVSLPAPVYGPYSFLYAIYFAVAVLALIIHSIQDLRSTSGREHAELAFILIAGISAMAFSLLLIQALGAFFELSRVIWFAPFRALVFSLVIACGIATRKVMEVGHFLRRILSYVVLTAYLLALYGGVWWLVSRVFEPTLGNGSVSLAHVTAALVVAFAMAPARGVSQELANRLFLGSRRLDFQSTMRKATDILQSVTTLRDLLKRFAVTTADAVGAEKVRILLLHRQALQQQYPTPDAVDPGLRFEEGHPVIQHLTAHPEPLVLDELHRIRRTPELERLMAVMEELQAAAIIGIFSREHLAGIMLLGPRMSGRIYGSVEQSALQVLCGQLAVAVENAQLFTEVQNAKIYNETLLENLTTGVIAAGGDGRITVFNREAEQITGLAARTVLEQPLEELPSDLRETLRVTLATGERHENAEVRLGASEREIVARVSSSVFHGENGERLGALMVLTDITAVKRLEAQIRRSDRLASLGTLSAGMAHEIKNPLVSIKTFTQLLPERYNDSDFRETFSNLIGHEIDRIDSLVNQLLRFARPAKPVLKAMHVHEVLEKSLMLVGHRLYQKEIKLTRSWDAEVDTIRADAGPAGAGLPELLPQRDGRHGARRRVKRRNEHSFLRQLGRQHRHDERRRHPGGAAHYDS
jgi:PAS domain S-box-containing protein